MPNSFARGSAFDAVRLQMAMQSRAARLPPAGELVARPEACADDGESKRLHQCHSTGTQGRLAPLHAHDVLHRDLSHTAPRIVRVSRHVGRQDHVVQGQQRAARGGSSWNTSSPAPRDAPAASARASASSSTRCPRPVFTRMAPFFIDAISLSPRSGLPACSRPAWSDTTSERERSSASGHEPDPVRRRKGRVRHRVIGDHLHAESLGAQADLPADAAQADDSQRLVPELHAHETLSTALPSCGCGRARCPGPPPAGGPSSDPPPNRARRRKRRSPQCPGHAPRGGRCCPGPPHAWRWSSGAARSSMTAADQLVRARHDRIDLPKGPPSARTAR